MTHHRHFVGSFPEASPQLCDTKRSRPNHSHRLRCLGGQGFEMWCPATEALGHAHFVNGGNYRIEIIEESQRLIEILCWETCAFLPKHFVRTLCKDCNSLIFTPTKQNQWHILRFEPHDNGDIPKRGYIPRCCEEFTGETHLWSILGWLWFH